MSADLPDLETLCREYERGQYVLVFDTDDGQTLTDHYATCDQVDDDEDIDLLAQYLIDRTERTEADLETALRELVERVNDRRRS